jgi:hypothetical protein
MCGDGAENLLKHVGRIGVAQPPTPAPVSYQRSIKPHQSVPGVGFVVPQTIDKASRSAGRRTGTAVTRLMVENVRHAMISSPGKA